MFAYNGFHLGDQVQKYITGILANKQGYMVNTTINYYLNSSSTLDLSDNTGDFYIAIRDWGNDSYYATYLLATQYWLKHPLVLFYYAGNKSSTLQASVLNYYNDWPGAMDQVILNYYVNSFYWTLYDDASQGFFDITNSAQATSYYNSISTTFDFMNVTSQSAIRTAIISRLTTDLGSHYNLTAGQRVNYPYALTTDTNITKALNLNSTALQLLGTLFQTTTGWDLTTLLGAIYWQPQDFANYVNLNDEQWGELILNYFNSISGFWTSPEAIEIAAFAYQMLATYTYTLFNYSTIWYSNELIDVVTITVSLDAQNYDIMTYSRGEGILLSRNTNIFIDNGSNFGNPLTGSFEVNLVNYSGTLQTTWLTYLIWFFIILGIVLFAIIAIAIAVSRHQKKLRELDY